VCPAPCETSCVLGINQPAVTIKNVEVSIIDEAFARGLVTPHVPERLTDSTIAVVGSGPAGLAAAQRVPRDVPPDLHAGPEARALGLHLRQAAVDVELLELEVRDAVAQQAADGVVALVHDDGVPGPGELLGGGQARRARADDPDGLAGQPLRGRYRHPVRSLHFP
jgi:hypothetical protein